MLIQLLAVVQNQVIFPGMIFFSYLNDFSYFQNVAGHCQNR